MLVYTQHYVRFKTEGYALVDIYYPQLNIAIEVDEPQHQKYRESDDNRERRLKEVLSCEVFRIDVSLGDVPRQVEALRGDLLKRMNLLKSSKNWKPWKEPSYILFEKLREELKGTMFVKICGEIHPGNLMERQTGYWFMDVRKQKKIQQVVVVHDGVVSRVFKDLEWRHTDPVKGHRMKWGYHGVEVITHDLIGTYVEGWDHQCTRMYSREIQ